MNNCLYVAQSLRAGELDYSFYQKILPNYEFTNVFDYNNCCYVAAIITDEELLLLKLKYEIDKIDCRGITMYYVASSSGSENMPMILSSARATD